MANLHIYTVGELYVPDRTQWEERDEYNYWNGYHILRIFWVGLKAEVITLMLKGDLQFSMTTHEDLLFLNYRAGGMEWSNIPYTVHLTPPEALMLPDLAEWEGKHAILSVFLVEATTGILKGLRTLTWSAEFTKAIHKAILAQADMPFDDTAYTAKIDTIYASYPSYVLAEDMAMITCWGGE